MKTAIDSIERNMKGRAAGSDQAAETFLRNMVKDGLGQSKKMDENFGKLADWAKKNNIRVIINEFGVYSKYSSPADASRWISDVCKSMEAHGFGWSIWDYCGDFSVTTGEPGARKFIPEMAKGMGLKTN